MTQTREAFATPQGGAPQDSAPGTTQQAAEKAREATEQTKSKLRDQLDQRSTEAGERVQSTAGDLRSVGEQMRQQGKEGPAKLADQAAERAERVGGYLKDSDADRILRDVEDFGRRQPMALLAGGLVAGFALSRFLKASSSRRYGSTISSSSPAALSSGTGSNGSPQTPQTPFSAGGA